ncbi:MAG: DUF5719 family protein [Candidatus Ancillula trichonymphae]|jgi:hypothetical protein|nr:DUF5719 family protein [Candidatus Ancillula trichonymphae]
MKFKVVAKMLVSVFTAVVLAASLIGIVSFAYLLHFLGNDNLDSAIGKTSMNIQNPALTCFSAPKVDTGLSNDEEFGAVKTPTASNVLLGALGEVQKAAFDELVPNTASTSLNTPANGGNLVVGSTSAAASTVFRGIFKTDDLPFAVAGIRFSSTPDGDLKGLAASQCIAPALDLWFIGGSTCVQSTTSVLIANANSTAAQVELTVWGAKRSSSSKVAKLEDGSLKYGASKTVGVDAHTQTLVNLASGAQDEDVVAVHLKSNFSPVAATVYTHEMDKLTPKGLDFLQSSSLSETVYLPGVKVSKDPHFRTSLQILAPEIHEQKATVTLKCKKSNDSGTPKTKTVDLVRGEVQTVETDFLEDGIWNIEITGSGGAKSALLAAAKFARSLDDGSQDYAYIPSAVPAHGLFGVVKTAAARFNPQLSFAAVGSAESNTKPAYTVTFFDSAGALIGSVQIQLDQTSNSFSLDSLAGLLSSSLANAGTKEELIQKISFVSVQPVDNSPKVQKIVGNIVYQEEVGLTAQGFSTLEKKSLLYKFTNKALIR